MKIQIHTDGEPGTKRLQAKFSQLAEGIKKRKPLFNRIGVQLLNAVMQNFKEQGHEGTPWTPLSRFTIARRRKGRGVKKGRGRILEDTGELRRSFAIEATDQSVRVGSPKIYAPTHEFGRGPIPKRPMLPSRERGLQIAVDVAESYTNELIERTKLKGRK